MENRVIVSGVILLLVISCYNTELDGKSSDFKISNQAESSGSKLFVPDTSIGGRIELINSESIKYFMNGVQDLEVYNDFVFALNTDASQCLSMRINYGGQKGEYGCFEVFNISDADEIKDKKYSNINFSNLKFFRSDFIDFRTGSGLTLGDSESRVIEIKGDDYSIESIEGEKILKYKISDTKSAFLRHYNMPLFVEEYHFKDLKLVRFSMGFEVP